MNTLADNRSRSHTAELIARQIAISNGTIWDKLQPKQRAVYVTLAQSCMATVERNMLSYKWDRQ